jgi:transcriptional regulator with XRE-family HTH domain
MVNAMLQRLGDRLRDARGERGLSLQAAAGAAQISTGYLHKLEAGRVGSPSPRVLRRLAAALGVPYRTLLELAGYLEPGDDPTKEDAMPATTPPPPTNQELSRLLGAIREDLARLEARQDDLARLVERALDRDRA